MPTSLVIRGGTVFDGTGAPGRLADVAIDGDRIVAIGSIPADSGARELDATGLAVAPGFINILSHAYASLQLQPRGQSDLLQGVTTEIFGEAVSLGPTSPTQASLIEARGLPEGVVMDFPRLSDGLSHLETIGVAPNVASFVGGHNLRMLGAGLGDEPMDKAALDLVRGVLDEEMADGALGLGTALIYPPGCFASCDELVALSEVMARHDGLYISHMRSEGDQFLECLDELIDIGRRAEVRTEVWHFKAAGRANWPKMRLAIDRIDAARAAGQSVGANMYPYVAGGTALQSSIPPSYHVGGPAALAQRLAEPAERKRMAADIRQASDEWENLFLASGGGQGVMLAADLKDGTKTDGRRLSDVAAELGMDEVDALLELVSRDSSVGALYFIIGEDNVQLGLQQPWVSIGSDAPAMAVPPQPAESTHPRVYGTFARILGHYSRDLGLMPLAEAIRRMTSLPADTLRLRDRGRIVEGAFADLVVLDAATVADTATFERPHSYATGVSHVVVNGEPVVVAGEFTDALPGRRLRRGV